MEEKPSDSGQTSVVTFAVIQSDSECGQSDDDNTKNDDENGFHQNS